MKETILTKKEAVEKYGTEAQKEHFDKYNKIKSKNVEEALIKTLKQYYESVDIVKQGRSNVYKLGVERGYIAEREDGRENNGNTIKLPYSYELNTLTIKYIIENCQDEMQQFSINTWLNAIGLVDRSFTSVAYNKRLKQQVMSNLIETFDDNFTGKDIALLDNFVMTERDRLSRNLKGLFNRLEKNKLIRQRITMFACTIENNHIELSKENEEKVTILKRELRKKHEVTPQEIRFKTNLYKVKDYIKEEKQELNKLGYKYTYTAHGILLNVPEEKINDYLDKIKKEGKLEFEIGLTEKTANLTLYYFSQNYGEHATYYAEERQNRVNNYEDNHIKVLKKAERYLPMYELLLIYFRLSSKPKEHIELKGFHT